MSDTCPVCGYGKDKPGMHVDCAVKLREWAEAVSDTVSSLTVEQWRNLYIGEFEGRFKAEAALAERDKALDDLYYFLKPGDVVTVSTPGKRGSITFSMDRLTDLRARTEEGSGE